MKSPGFLHRFFIQEHLHKKVFHGGTGLADIERILVADHFIPIEFPCHNQFDLRAKWLRIVFLIKTVISLPANTVVVFEFPLYARMNRALVWLLHFRRKIFIICFITDIDGFKSGDDRLLESEKKQLKHFRYFIVHHINMEKWLHSFNPGAQCTRLNFFDFLAAYPRRERKMESAIAFAGFLAKSPFLFKLGQLQRLQPSLKFLVYGEDPAPEMLSQPNIIYKGAVDPYALPSVIEGAFGLVWDGKGIEGPEGIYGHYMHYITHHKVSLYILSGMPLIVHEDAGSAALVLKYGIGFTIRSLYELEEKINALSEKEYREMIANTRALAPLIATGKNLENASKEIINCIVQRHFS